MNDVRGEILDVRILGHFLCDDKSVLKCSYYAARRDRNFVLALNRLYLFWRKVFGPCVDPIESLLNVILYPRGRIWVLLDDLIVDMDLDLFALTVGSFLSQSIRIDIS